MKRGLKASYTVEAAFILPLVFALLYAVIFLGFYLHDRAVMEQCAWEGAFYGAGQDRKVSESEIDHYIRERLEGRLLVTGTEKIEVHLQKKEVTAEISGEAGVPGFIEALLGYWREKEMHVKRSVPYPCAADYVRRGLVISEQLRKLLDKESEEN